MNRSRDCSIASKDVSTDCVTAALRAKMLELIVRLQLRKQDTGLHSSSKDSKENAEDAEPNKRQSRSANARKAERDGEESSDDFEDPLKGKKRARSRAKA